MVLLLATALKFIRRAWQLTVCFVLQSYIALVFAFAGVYLLLFFVDQDSLYVPRRAWTNQVDIPLAAASHPAWFTVSLYWEFAYFALVVQSSVGFGDVYPLLWWSRLACTVHMVVAVVANVALLGFGLAHVGEAVAARQKKEREGEAKKGEIARATEDDCSKLAKACGWCGYSEPENR